TNTIASTSLRSALTTVFKRRIEIGLRRLQCRNETKQKTCRDGHRERKTKHAQIDSDLIKSWCIRWRDRNQQFDQPDTQRESCQTTHDRKHHALSQELSDNAQPTRTERCPQGNLFLTRCSTS